MDQILEIIFFKAIEGFRTGIRSCSRILHLIWIKSALWVFKTLNSVWDLFDPKEQDYPDPIAGMDSVGYPVIWYLDHSDPIQCSLKTVPRGSQPLGFPFCPGLSYLYI